jgi:hypothetical protein
MALSADDRNAIKIMINRLVGQRLAGVRYVTVDYDRWQLAPDSTGRRSIIDDKEWRSPSWRYSSGDSVDFGIELVMQEGTPISITWDSPGPREGLVIHDGIISRHANAAVWDVAVQSKWEGFIGHDVTEVVPHFAKWGQSASELWLPRISVHFGKSRVELLLGQIEHNGTQLVPAANNVAILFNPSQLPGWIPAEVSSA